MNSSGGAIQAETLNAEMTIIKVALVINSLAYVLLHGLSNSKQQSVSDNHLEIGSTVCARIQFLML